MWKRLQRVGKDASKFQFTASYQELEVECTKKWYGDCSHVPYLYFMKKSIKKICKNNYKISAAVVICLALFHENSMKEQFQN